MKTMFSLLEGRRMGEDRAVTVNTNVMIESGALPIVEHCTVGVAGDPVGGGEMSSDWGKIVLKGPR